MEENSGCSGPELQSGWLKTQLLFWLFSQVLALTLALFEREDYSGKKSFWQLILILSVVSWVTVLLHTF